eukprot:TRINITY_DN457_c0_g1_i1.p1 TRINITY_DN457_c0_g1~~TRINITY_DN457_c0_g1_i1.p1  ORF type:complete len:964 (-),score=161.84 TRINITY_DN457_c0_g1_i1:28-2919(-)
MLRSLVGSEMCIRDRGYSMAFNSTNVQNRVLLYEKGIAISVIFWSTPGVSSAQSVVDVVIPWRLINDATSLRKFISDFETNSLARLSPAPNPYRRFLGWTTLATTLLFPSRNVRDPSVNFPGALYYFDNNGFTSQRKVIDVSSDGTNNILGNGIILDQTPSQILGPDNTQLVTNARTVAVSKNIVMNALTILSDSGTGLPANYTLADYYRDYVITNDPEQPAFVLQASNFNTFRTVIEQKLVRETSGNCFERRQNVTLDPIFLRSNAENLPQYNIAGGSFIVGRNPSWFNDTLELAQWLTMTGGFNASICFNFGLSVLTNIDLLVLRYRCASPSANVSLNGQYIASCSPSNTLPTTELNIITDYLRQGANSLCFNVIRSATSAGGIWIDFPLDVLRTFECDSFGSFNYDSFCDYCQCMSGFFGQCCEKKIGNTTEEGPCNYTPFENLTAKKNHTAKIDRSLTGFNAGALTITIEAGAVERTFDNARRSVLSVGRRSLNAILNGAPYHPPQCRCFTKTSLVGIPEIGNDICADMWRFSAPWPEVRDSCCSVDLSDPLYLTYDCTIDVAHSDSLVFEGSWKNVTNRGRFTRVPLPLYVQFQRAVNLTSFIQVFSDLDIKAYIQRQEYDPTTNLGTIVIDVVTLWPYTLSLVNLTQQFPNSYFLSTSFIPVNEVNRTCNNVPGSKCWQSVVLSVSLAKVDPPICNLDNTFVMSFSYSCRGSICPPQNVSQENTTLVATIRTEDFCPSFTIQFPLNGSLSTYLDGFSFLTDKFIVYTYPINTNVAAKLCVKASAEVITQSIKVSISAAYYISLILFNPANARRAVLLQNGVICPNFTSECNNPNQIGLQIDTATDFGNFPDLNPEDAGACFYPTRNSSVNGPRGLVDELGINWLEDQSPFQLQLIATVGVNFENLKRSSDQEAEQELTIYSSFDVSLPKSVEQNSNSGSVVLFNLALVIISALFLIL